MFKRYRELSLWEKCDFKLNVLGIVGATLLVGLVAIGLAWATNTKFGFVFLIAWAITAIICNGAIGLWLCFDR